MCAPTHTPCMSKSTLRHTISSNDQWYKGGYKPCIKRRSHTLADFVKTFCKESCYGEFNCLSLFSMPKSIITLSWLNCLSFSSVYVIKRHQQFQFLTMKLCSSRGASVCFGEAVETEVVPDNWHGWVQQVSENRYSKFWICSYKLKLKTVSCFWTSCFLPDKRWTSQMPWISWRTQKELWTRCSEWCSWGKPCPVPTHWYRYPNMEGDVTLVREGKVEII